MPARATVKVAGPRVFDKEDAYKTWRVLARNPQYTGETEGIGFSNGQASVTALPRSVRCKCSAAGREYGEGGCRLHERLDKLNALLNYTTYQRAKNPQTNKFEYEKLNGYRILSESEYDAEFGDIQEEIDDLLDV